MKVEIKSESIDDSQDPLEDNFIVTTVKQETYDEVNKTETNYCYPTALTAEEIDDYEEHFNDVPCNIVLKADIDAEVT